MTAWAAVAVARPFPHPLTYAVPAWLAGVEGGLRVGHPVLVPLGPTSETGFVVDLPDDPGVDAAKVRPIARLLDPEPVFDARQLAFFQWIAGYYLAPLGLVIATAVPREMKARSVRGLVPTGEGIDALALQAPDGPPALVLREAIARPGLTRRGLAQRLRQELDADAVKKATDALVRRGWAAWEEREVGRTQATVATVQLADGLDADAAVAALPSPSPRQVALLRALAGGALDVDALLADHGAAARATLNGLVKRGVVARGEREDRDALAAAPALGARVAPALNPDQVAALAALTGPDAARPWLLFGVTGAGKTEVFLGAARAALDRGQQVCVLVPEIGLTPQLVGRFKARFGDDVVVLHSGLTATERLAAWRRVRAGEARVAVGARSALFAPFTDLGLIVVDEEHDDSYKQDEGVSYHARDLAVVLGRRWGCPVVLASATPSLESWHNAREGRYGLLRLPHRATARAVPDIELVDMTAVDKGDDGQRPLFAPEVVGALRQTFDRGGKAIVLYNRRGFATLVQCASCGGAYECPSCGVGMTLHQGAAVLACHYCGFKRPYDGTCPACGSAELEELGKGTERVEGALAALFPDVPVGRMDADTTAVRGAHHSILEDFRLGRTRLLVGTQIVAKGHDFPDVHTAVVVSADHSLRMPDFRAAERTVALLVQVAGRAGRGEVAGRVLVQTYRPQHTALSDLGDVEAFLEAESRQRRVLRYPPWARLVLVRLDGPDRKTVLGEAGKLVRALRASARDVPGVDVLGPAAAALPRLVGRWRFQVILRGLEVGPFRAWLGREAPRLLAAGGGGVRVSVDVDPRHLM